MKIRARGKVRRFIPLQFPILWIGNKKKERVEFLASERVNLGGIFLLNIFQIFHF